MNIRYLSLFSGIEAATVAWEPLGWTPVAFAQYEPDINAKRKANIRLGVYKEVLSAYTKLGCSSRT